MPGKKTKDCLNCSGLFRLRAHKKTFSVDRPFFNVFRLLGALLAVLLAALFGRGASNVVYLALVGLLVANKLILVCHCLGRVIQVSSQQTLLLAKFAKYFFAAIILSFAARSCPFSFFLLIFSLLVLSERCVLAKCVGNQAVLFLSFLYKKVAVAGTTGPTVTLFLGGAPF